MSVKYENCGSMPSCLVAASISSCRPNPTLANHRPPIPSMNFSPSAFHTQAPSPRTMMVEPVRGQSEKSVHGWMQ